MAYHVISRFRHRPTGEYVDPGEPCPDLDPDTAARLVRAGCLVISRTPASPIAAQPAATPATVPGPRGRRRGGRRAAAAPPAEA